MEPFVSLQSLNYAGSIVLLLATVAYCGLKMCWRPHFLFQVAAHVALFAAVLVLGLLCFTWVNGNVPLLRRVVRRFIRPARDVVEELVDFF